VAQPWHELANVHERNGQPADARWMRWQAAEGVTRTSRPWPKVIRRIYGALTCHGYYPLIAALWLVGAIFVSWLIIANTQAAFTPTAANKWPGTPCRPVRTADHGLRRVSTCRTDPVA